MWLIAGCSAPTRVHRSISGAPVLVLESNPDLLDPQNEKEKKDIFEKVLCVCVCGVCA